MYNNDPKYMNPPEAGLASLLASRGRNGDSVLVHMAPEELKGLQGLAAAHGGKLSVNPDTGLYEASFLKKILPMIAGAVLPSIPGVGQFAKTIGFGSEALGTALLVGGATGLIEGDLKKGLMAGLGAYSGATLSEGLKAASIAGTPAEIAAEAAPVAEAAKAGQAVEAARGTVGATAEATRLSDVGGVFSPKMTTPPAISGISIKPVDYTPYTPPPPTPSIMGGISALMKPEGRSAFMGAMGGGFQSPLAQNLSKYAVMTGVADALTPQPKAMPMGGGASEDIVYIPGGFNPQYGSGKDQPFQLPGRYYKRTPQGLVPYNPFQLAPGARGFAQGGAIQAQSIPHQYNPLPNRNDNYPLSTVVQANYQPNSPQPREVVSGYEVKIDPYTGEEKFAEGGPVQGPLKVSPYAMPTEDQNVLATRAYIEELNRRARNPYAGVGGGGIGGAGGLSSFGTPGTYQPSTGGAVGGDGSSGGGLGAIAGGIAANYLINKGIGAGVDYLRDKFGGEQQKPYKEPISDSLQAVDLAGLPATMAAIDQLSALNTAPPKTYSYKVEEVPDVIEQPVAQPAAPTTPAATSSVPFTSAALGALSATSPFMNVSPLPPTRTTVEPVSYEGEEMVVREDPTATQQPAAQPAAPTPPATSAIPYTLGALNALSPFAAAPSAIPVVGEPVYDALGQVTGFKYPDGTIEPVEGYQRQPDTLDADLQAKTRVGGDMSAPLSSYLSAGSSGLAGLASLGSAAKTGLTSIIPLDPATGAVQTFLSPGSSAAANAAAAESAKAAGAEVAGAGTGAGAASKIIPGIQAALGLYEAYKGIESGKEGRAALGGFGAGAGIATLAGATPGFGALAAAGPIGLAAAAIAAIGASMVNTKEFGDVALRNYWNAVDQGRGIGETDPVELAQGFINFYRTNKNNFAGQEKYGRTGNEDFVYDMTQVINNAVKEGKIDKNVDAATMYQQVVQPWLNSMGSGPQNEDAKRIQDFMMTDLINSFMQGKPISNAQVKGDSKFKIVSEKPVYAGTAQPTPEMALPTTPDIQDLIRQAAERQGPVGAYRNIFEPRTPFAELGADESQRVNALPQRREDIMPVGVTTPIPSEEPVGPTPLSLPEEPPFDPMRGVSLNRGDRIPVGPTPFSSQDEYPIGTPMPVRATTPVPEEPIYVTAFDGPNIAEEDPEFYRRAFEDLQRETIMPVEATTPIPEEPFYMPEYERLSPFAENYAAMPFERMSRYAGGGAIGDDYNFGFAGGGMPPMPEYRAGGKLLRGRGDGMSDDIPAVIRGKGEQRAALADGEFVVPADVVSHLGNGSTNAGAKKLYQMMARVRRARTGKSRQAPAVKVDRYLPA